MLFKGDCGMFRGGEAASNSKDGNLHLDLIALLLLSFSADC